MPSFRSAGTKTGAIRPSHDGHWVPAVAECAASVLFMKCPTCSHANPAGQRFCGQCGARLEGIAADGPAVADRSYTPPHLAAKILQSRSALEGERKQVTVLFCDIANSTPLAERIGPERMHKVLNAFFEVALAEVHRFEGTVNQFLGDGFMALFGAPVSHEDHARRAALAALAIRKAIASDARFQVPEIALATRIGLNTGAVVVGRIGDNLRMDYTAIGDTTNVAARIQGVAEPGTILASDSVVRSVGEHVECRPVGLRTLKGKAEPIALHEIMREQGHRARAATRADATLVGRQAELQAIEESLGQLQAGEGGVLAIVGQAGLGKSRLLEEVVRRAAGHGLRCVQGSCLSFGRTLSYWSFREAIRATFDIGDADSEAASWHKLEAGMRRLFGENAAELLPYVGTLIALALPEALVERIRALDGLSMGHQIFRSALLLFEQLAQERPTVVVLEDWHWADASSAELLEHLLQLAERVPLLFVVAYRPEPQGSAAALNNALAGDERTVRRVRTLTLAPLPTAQSAELAERLLGGGSMPAEVRDMLLRRSGGNPFYLGELVRALIGTKGIERDSSSGDWHLTEQYGAVPLPDTIEGVILARIDRLEDEVKQVLKAAAVVGRTFFYRVLKAVTETDAALDDDLVKLRGAELIDEKQLAPELEYVFKHPLIQQATYDSMLEDRRRELHRQVGHSIETLFVGRLEPFYSMLAYHYVKAKEADKGREYLLKAAEHADRLAADEEALELYEAVIETLEKQTPGGLDPLRRAELDYKVGDAHFRAGRHEPALLNFARALHRLGESAPRRKWILDMAAAIGLCRQMLRRFVPAAIRPSFRAMTASQALACQIWESTAWINFFVDLTTAIYGVVRMCELSSRDTRSRSHAVGLSLIGMMFTTVGAYRTAGWAHAKARELALRHGDAVTQAYADHFCAWHLHHIGEWNAAVQLDEEAGAKCWGSGVLRLWSTTTVDLALYAHSLGAPMREVAERLSRVANQTPDCQAQAWGLSMIALELGRRGEHEAAIGVIDQTTATYKSIPDHRLLACMLGLRCFNLRKLGRLEEAEKSCKEALLIQKLYRLTGTISTFALLAAAELRLEQFEGGPQRTGARHAAAVAVKAMLRQGRRVRDQGAVESQRVAGTFEWLCGERKRALSFWSKGLDEAKALGARHAEGRIFFERGRRTGSDDDLQRAALLFQQCGALGEQRELEAFLAGCARTSRPSPMRQ